MGYNAATGKYVDMIAAGILDPTKVSNKKKKKRKERKRRRRKERKRERKE